MAENDQFTNGGSSKVENDPWVPLETDQFANKDAADLMRTDLPSPQNPLYQLIDSEKYIQSLGELYICGTQLKFPFTSLFKRSNSNLDPRL